MKKRFTEEIRKGLLYRLQFAQEFWELREILEEVIKVLPSDDGDGESKVLYREGKQ